MYVVHDTQLVIGQSLFTGKCHNISFGIYEYIFAALNIYVDVIGLCRPTILIRATTPLTGRLQTWYLTISVSCHCLWTYLQAPILPEEQQATSEKCDVAITWNL